MVRLRWVSVAGLSLSIVLASWYWLASVRDELPVVTPRMARYAFKQGNYPVALSICQQLLHEHGDTPEILIMAGESASRLDRFQESVEFYERVPDSAGRDAATARWAAGEVLLHMRQMSRTIDLMERSLVLDPQRIQARDRLVYLLNLSGRRWDARPHLLALLENDQWQVQHLLYLGNLSKSIENENELREFQKGAPQDLLPLLGVARIRSRTGAYEEATELLERVLEQHPKLVEAHVQLGKIWVHTDPQRIPSWNRSLPVAAENHPDIWHVRGEWARNRNELESSVRCFCEVLRRDPDNLAALNGLVPILNQLGESNRAKQLVERASQLESFLAALEHIMSNEWSVRRANSGSNSGASEVAKFLGSEEQVRPILTASQRAFELGRTAEAGAWAQYGLSFAPQHKQLLDVAQQIQQRRERKLSENVAVYSFLNEVWISRFKLPNWDVVNERPPPEENPSLASGSEARFEEIVNALDFTYFASRNSFPDGRRMFEMTGGGIGVLDYDRDGWPDLFFSQGRAWPPVGNDPQHSDCLKRNTGGQPADSQPTDGQPIDGQSFADVTRSAGITENQFGQGVTIGDVDNDGFDDIYVGNVGRNQLWLNQGDGTYRDGNATIASDRESWTASAVIADLNNDGTAEIYDANYVEGEDVYERRCAMGGLPRACSPLNFRPAQGRLLSVDDNGIWHDVSKQVIDGLVREGNALGLSVLRMQGAQLPSIFVANDQVGNLLLSPVPDVSSPLGIRLQDQATVCGLAFDGEGKAQACMGIAAGDVNADGAIDLLVTNYHDEPNTLYLQQNGLFRDSTREARLVAPSLKMLGFGAQWLDADLDGRIDLVVLNGHIDDMSHMGVPFRMRAQFFASDGQTRFREKFAADVGSYFAVERLGRALALLDFDRDGRLDFIAGELDGPTRLVRNVSERNVLAIHRFVTITLVGTKSHRDAIGTEVSVTTSGQTWVQQLTGGCGYMVTNQKRLHFGLNSTQNVDRIEIVWPSGLKQTHTNVAVDTHWIAIEGRPDLVGAP